MKIYKESDLDNKSPKELKSVVLKLQSENHRRDTILIRLFKKLSTYKTKEVVAHFKAAHVFFKNSEWAMLNKQGTNPAVRGGCPICDINLYDDGKPASHTFPCGVQGCPYG